MLRLTFFIVLIQISTIFSQGTEWVVYDTTNSGFPDNRILSNSLEQNGNKWFCMAFHGLVKFDGSTGQFMMAQTQVYLQVRFIQSH